MFNEGEKNERKDFAVIELEVVSLRGARLQDPPRARFGPAGGTIGRANTNTLVLDDPDRTVSRVHAQVQLRDGRYVVVDRGSNPMQHNGQPLGPTREVVLSIGDRLNVGSFELMVKDPMLAADAAGVGATASSAGASLLRDTAPSPLSAEDDPFADLLAGLGAPAPVPSPVPSPAFGGPPARPGADASALPDPMDPFATGRHTPSPSRGGAASAEDPFADLFGSVPGGSDGVGGSDRASNDFAAPLAGPAVRIDDLFGGLDAPGASAASLLDDPFLSARSPASEASSGSLLDMRPTTPPHQGETRSDHLPIDRFGFAPPKAIVPEAPPAKPLAPSTPMPSTPMPSTPSKPAQPPSAAPRPRFDDETGAPLASRNASGASDAALLDAFLRGLGNAHQPPASLTPELMERIGAMLRASTEGTLQLLQARQQLKREVRAEVTMIAAQANNPLKFSPTVEVALAHLLGPGMRGFMEPTTAMRDAYDDLRAHEFGVMVGMRAALAHVLARFTPDELEKKIAAKSALDSLFTSNRKARLWDQFIALYAGIAAEAEDDFQTLFGQAFNEAYAEQMARLKNKN